MMPIDALWARRERVANLLSKVDTSSDLKLGRISQHDRIEISADGGQKSVWVRQILRAEQDGPDRWALVFETEESDVLPEIVNVRNCHLGRIARDHEANIMVAEMMFERPLTRGETLIMEYQLVFPEGHAPKGNNTFARKFRLPVREYVIEVRFDETNLPSRVQQYSVPAGDETPSRRRNLTLDSGGGVHAVALGQLGALERCLDRLLGEGQQRGSVPMLGYLFYVGDPDRTDLPYLREPDGAGAVRPHFFRAHFSHVT